MPTPGGRRTGTLVRPRGPRSTPRCSPWRRASLPTWACSWVAPLALQLLGAGDVRVQGVQWEQQVPLLAPASVGRPALLGDPHLRHLAPSDGWVSVVPCCRGSRWSGRVSSRPAPVCARGQLPSWDTGQPEMRDAGEPSEVGFGPRRRVIGQMRRIATLPGPCASHTNGAGRKVCRTWCTSVSTVRHPYSPAAMAVSGVQNSCPKSMSQTKLHGRVLRPSFHEPPARLRGPHTTQQEPSRWRRPLLLNPP
jgi:hypothetical protein